MNSWHSTIKNSLPPPFPPKKQKAETYQWNQREFPGSFNIYTSPEFFLSNWGTISHAGLGSSVDGVLAFYQWIQEFCEWMSVTDEYQSITGKIHSVKYSSQSTAWKLDVWWWNNSWEVTRKLFCQNNCIALTATCCKPICAMLHENLYALLR